MCHAIQVCMELNAENRQRDIDGLPDAMQFFKLKELTIVTLNQEDTLQLNGNKIPLAPAHDFFHQ